MKRDNGKFRFGSFIPGCIALGFILFFYFAIWSVNGDIKYSDWREAVCKIEKSSVERKRSIGSFLQLNIQCRERKVAVCRSTGSIVLARGCRSLKNMLPAQSIHARSIQRTRTRHISKSSLRLSMSNCCQTVLPIKVI